MRAVSCGELLPEHGGGELRATWPCGTDDKSFRRVACTDKEAQTIAEKQALRVRFLYRGASHICWFEQRKPQLLRKR